MEEKFKRDEKLLQIGNKYYITWRCHEEILLEKICPICGYKDDYYEKIDGNKAEIGQKIDICPECGEECELDIKGR